MPDHTPPRSAAESLSEPVEDRSSSPRPKAPRDRGGAAVPPDRHRQGDGPSASLPGGERVLAEPRITVL